MSDPSEQNSVTDPSADWTEKQLPPVTPPTTGLLMQLFFVPMIIVSIIVAVWLLFGWLAQSGRNPEQLAANLKQLNKGSWQDAHYLSNLLRDPREKELRKNEELAASLAETLNGLLTVDLQLDDDRQKLALWLCRALGEFEIDAGLPTLLTALENPDFEVRCAAAEGISILAGGLGAGIRDSHPDLVSQLTGPAMERAESAEREQEIAYGELRSSVAFALGIIGGTEACNTLAVMLSDPYPGARYNAATGLARNGDVRAVPRLCEMLSLDNEEAIRYEALSGTLRAWKQHLVIVNGLRGVHTLYTENADAPIDERVREAVDVLEASDQLTARDNAKYVLGQVARLIQDRASLPDN